MARFHIECRPRRQSDRKRADHVGAIIEANDAWTATARLFELVSRQPLPDEQTGKVHLTQLDALTFTVERTDEHSL